MGTLAPESERINSNERVTEAVQKFATITAFRLEKTEIESQT